MSNANEQQKLPVNERGLFQQGIQMSADGNWTNAEKIFRGIAERNPSWPEPKNNLAVALYKSGKLEQSNQAFEDAVTSLPSFKVAQLNRQKLYDYYASLAYNKAAGINKKPGMPKLEMLNELKDIPTIASETGIGSVKENPGNTDEAYKQVKNSLLKWSESWSDSNVEQYLSAYSNEFIPSAKFKDFSRWSKQRREKLSNQKIDRVSLDAIQVYIDNSKKQALAEFVQDYKSSNYHDKVLKRIRLAYKNDRWLIVSEEVLQKLN